MELDPTHLDLRSRSGCGSPTVTFILLSIHSFTCLAPLLQKPTSLCIPRTLFVLQESPSFVKFFVFRMASFHTEGYGAPFMVPLDNLGEVCVHEQLMSLRFAFHIGTIYVEKEIFDDSSQICETILQRKSTTAEGDVWNLTRGMYRVFGFTDAQLSASTVLVTPRNSTSTVQVPTQPTVKIEPSNVNVHVISDSDDDAIPDGPTGDTSRIPIRRCGSIGSTCSLPTPDLRRSPSISSSRPPVHPDFQRPRSVVEALIKTASRKGSRSKLASLDVGSLQVEQVNYLPPQFDGNKIFELLLLPQGCPTLYGGDMDGMGKQYDGHTWCKTMTTNIANDFGLKFRKSTCTGHLRCPNSSCEFVYRNSGKVNETEWTRVALSPFAVREGPPPKSTLAYKVCHTPPVCLALYDARIYYVFSSNSDLTRVAIHTGHHVHPVSDGVCLDSLDLMYDCVAQEVTKTPNAKN